MNLGYGLDELAMHDPTIPKAYFDAFPVANNDQNGGGTNLFAPSIDSSALARLYGVLYIIVQPPNPIPKGMKYVASLRHNGVTLKVAEVVNSGRFEFVYGQPPGQLLDVVGAKPASGGDHLARPYRVNEKRTIFYSGSHPSDTVYNLSLTAAKAGILYAKITDISGWHATVNGHSVAIDKSPGDLMEIRLPKGKDNVTFTYAPSLLNAGYWLALVAIVILAGLYILEQSVYRRQSKAKKVKADLTGDEVRA